MPLFKTIDRKLRFVRAAGAIQRFDSKRIAFFGELTAGKVPLMQP
jgi:hypothetical protein